MSLPRLNRLSSAVPSSFQSFLLVVVLFLSIGRTCGAPFKTSEERIPTEVREAIAKQIKAYFKTNEVFGLPLVDSKIDWNDFANWPDEFAFRGESYMLRLSKGTQTNRESILRSEAKRGSVFNATYTTKGSGDVGRVSPLQIWFEDGSVYHKQVRVWNEESYPYTEYLTWKSKPEIRESLSKSSTLLFALTFYRTGELNEFVTKSTLTDYFARNGKLIGSVGHELKTGGHELKWEGHEVDYRTFCRLKNDLFKPDAKPD